MSNSFFLFFHKIREHVQKSGQKSFTNIPEGNNRKKKKKNLFFLWKNVAMNFVIVSVQLT